MVFDHIIDDTEFKFQVIYENEKIGQIGIFHHTHKIGRINYRFLPKTPNLLYVATIMRMDEYQHQSIGYRLLKELIRRITKIRPEVTTLVLIAGKYHYLWMVYGFLEERNYIESINPDAVSKFTTNLAYHIEKNT